MIKQIKSFKYAFEGIWYTIRNETHMRVHIAIAVLVLIFGALYELAPGEWAIIIITIAAVMALELVNTASERLCNLYTEEIHPLVKIIKDVSAGAVLIAAIGSVAVAGVIFIKPEKITEIFFLFIENPIYIIGLIVYIVIAVIFVVKFHPKKQKSSK